VRALRQPEPDDAELVDRLRHGDERAWAEFLDRYERLIYAVPRRMGFDADEAADVLQEVALAFLRGLPRLRDAKTVPRWLAQAAYRIARDRRARHRRELRPDDESFWETVADPVPEVAETLEVFRARQEVRAALAQLSERCRDLLSLLFLTDPAPSYAEIARRLSRPVGSLGPTRQRCLKRALEVLRPRGIKPASDSTSRSSAQTPRAGTRRSR
jgi:RNA polymerase sigma factor (sigma-70 family)